MSTITADPTLLLVLGQMKEVTEIKDADGNVVGIYTPKALTADDIRKMFDIEKACERYEKEKHLAKPFGEIVAKLRKMERAEAAKPKKRSRKTA